MGYWRLTGGIRVPGRQPGQLRIDLAHHRPDGRDPRRQGRRIRALAVGVELVDGLSHAPESRSVYRTHRRRLSGRWRLRACLRKPSYPQVSGPLLWKKDVDHQPGNPPEVFLSHTRWTAFPQFIAVYLWPRQPFPQTCPQAAHNVVGVSAHVVHIHVHRVTWSPAWRAARMSEPSARTVSGAGSSAFGLGSRARGGSVR
jgi:hypothetical protein